jgi:hypothetical protein
VIAKTENLSPASTFEPETGPSRKNIDLTRGARDLGLQPHGVFLELEVLDDHGVVINSLGQNAAGTILAVLGCQLAMGPGGVPDETISVCLIRRDDGQMMDVDLSVKRIRQNGAECLFLRKTGERAINFEITV